MRDKDWYAELGKYVVEQLDINKIPSLGFFADKLKEKNLITKIANFSSKDRTYSSIGIFFITSTLDEEALNKMFGEPIYHNEFGEGFDEEFEKYDEYSYASYFVNIDGVDMHIGYDHRGTNIEIGIPFDDRHVSKDKVEKVINSLKKLVDLYKKI